MGGFGLAVWVSCNVYDESLLKGSGAGVTVGATGGSSESGGTGGTEVTGGRAGSETGATGGTTAGSAAAGKGGTDADGGKGGSSGKGGSGGTGGTSGGSAGKGGAGTGGSGGASAGKGGVGGSSGTLGMAGDMGEGGAPDCMTLGDCCPSDPDKTEPGVCDCGTADTDTDGDGTPDCDDMCPMDDVRVVPGACGCDVMADEADCATLKGALVHRYSFSGTGTTVTDSKGSLDGTVNGTGATLSGTGTLVLAGGVAPANDANKQYVDLGTGCLTGLTDATFEVWINWSNTCTGSGCTNALDWQRIFDFGETATTTTGSYVFLTPRAGRTNNPVFAAGTTTGANNEVATGFRANNATALAAGAHHFALVIDDAADEVRMYVDGAEIGTGAYATTASLGSINVTECFLGRSHYSSDPYLNGTFDEFRIYDAALPARAISMSYAQGPNAPFL